MNYWLMKSEPGAYSWDDLVKDEQTFWDGVRNYTARNNMKLMKNGDKVLFYHSVKDPGVIGVASIIKEHYPDPTIDDDRWVAVDIKPEQKLNNPVSLKQIKGDQRFAEMVLVKLGRLSVQPVKKEEFDLILSLGK